MGILSVILLGIIPTVLFLIGGWWAARNLDGEPSHRQLFFYLLAGSVLLLLVQFLAGLLARIAGWESLSFFMYLLMPVILAFLALLLLNLKALKGSSLQERRKGLMLGAALVLLLAGILVQTNDVGLLILAGAILLALVWAVASRWDAAGILLSLLVLLAIFGVVSTELREWIDGLPAWLGGIFTLFSGVSAAFAVALAAVLIASALRKFQQARSTSPAPAGLWFSAFLGFGLALLLLACLAYAIVWLSIWDQTSDGMGGVLFAMESGLMGVAAGAVMGVKAKRWFRSSGFFFALLVPVLMFGAFSYGMSVSYHELTQQRAERIAEALERYHARLGQYPAELGELTPRELLWVPGQVILQREDWCYRGVNDRYLLGAYWRQHFSTPLELKIYASAGDPLDAPLACQARLKELKQLYDFPAEPVEQP
jgi:hypothetical protein